MRVNAARDGHVQHAGHRDVVDIGRRSRYQAWVFLSLQSLTDVPVCHDFTSVLLASGPLACFCWYTAFGGLFDLPSPVHPLRALHYSPSSVLASSFTFLAAYRPAA